MCRIAWAALLLLGGSACSLKPATSSAEPLEARGSVVPRQPSTSAAPPREGAAGSSHGSGGLPCQRRGRVSSGKRAYTYCVARVAGAELKIIEPQGTAPGEPLRLAIYLHADGALAHDGDNALRIQAPWTASHRTLYVSARAPNGCGWWIKPEVTRCNDDERDRDGSGENAAVLARVIEALRSGWNLDNGPILFGGSSGGSVLLTSTFLPKYGDRYPGIFALGCGGEMPWTGRLEWNGTSPQQRGPTKLFFTYGDRDDYLADIRSSIVYYSRLGFPVDEKVVPDAGHCQFDHLGRTVEIWAQSVGEE